MKMLKYITGTKNTCIYFNLIHQFSAFYPFALLLVLSHALSLSCSLQLDDFGVPSSAESYDSTY